MKGNAKNCAIELLDPKTCLHLHKRLKLCKPLKIRKTYAKFFPRK